jgi:hypothetical protein
MTASAQQYRHRMHWFDFLDIALGHSDGDPEVTTGRAEGNALI